MNINILNDEIEYLQNLTENIDNFKNQNKIKIFVNYKLELIKNFINKIENNKGNNLNNSNYKLRIQKYQNLLEEEEAKININTLVYDKQIEKLECELINYAKPKIIKEFVNEKKEENKKIDIYKLKKKNLV